MFTPVNQVRLTNVAIVRLKRKGKRFEIACYKNKVISWRKGVEKDLDEVLQSQRVFSNVSKGTLAKGKDLQRCFETKDETAICKTILEKGSLQVTQKERKAEAESMLRDVATIVADKCINTDNNLPFPVDIIQTAMKSVKFSLKPNRSAKQHALDLIQQLKESKELPIARAQMRIQITVSEKQAKEVKKRVLPLLVATEKETWEFDYRAIARIDPGAYPEINKLVAAGTRGTGRVEIIDFKVQQEAKTFE